MARVGLQVLRDKMYEATHPVNTNITKADVARATDSVIDTITEALAAGDEVIIPGFGTFESVDRKERDGRNPQTGEKIKIAAKKSVKFKAGKSLKDAVNK